MPDSYPCRTRCMPTGCGSWPDCCKPAQKSLGLCYMPPNINIPGLSDAWNRASGSSSKEEEQSHALLASVTEASGTKAPSGSCDTMRAFRHSRTRMLHYGHVLHSDKTGCGRLLSEAYYVFSDSTDLVYPKCQHCFGHYV